jgi:hypothetical protein
MIEILEIFNNIYKHQFLNKIIFCINKNILINKLFMKS